MCLKLVDSINYYKSSNFYNIVELIRSEVPEIFELNDDENLDEIRIEVDGDNQASAWIIFW